MVERHSTVYLILQSEEAPSAEDKRHRQRRAQEKHHAHDDSSASDTRCARTRICPMNTTDALVLPTRPSMSGGVSR